MNIRYKIGNRRASTKSHVTCLIAGQGFKCFKAVMRKQLAVLKPCIAAGVSRTDSITLHLLMERHAELQSPTEAQQHSSSNSSLRL